MNIRKLCEQIIAEYDADAAQRKATGHKPRTYGTAQMNTITLARYCLGTAPARTYEEGIEDAAKVVENYSDQVPRCGLIANEIRALSPKGERG